MGNCVKYMAYDSFVDTWKPFQEKKLVKRSEREIFRNNYKPLTKAKNTYSYNHYEKQILPN